MKIPLHDTDSNHETELKLLIAPEDAECIRHLGLLEEHALAPPRTEELTSTYFDTADLRIHHGGGSLRLRKLERGCVQTLKGQSSSRAGLHERAEWEAAVKAPSLDLPALRQLVGRHTHWGKMLAALTTGPALLPIFDTHVIRTVWQLRLPGGDELEFALDQGMIRHQDRQAPISEIELELKSGKVENLYHFAREIAESVPLRLGVLSKSERGYALSLPGTTVAAPRKAAKILLTPRMTVAEGFRVILAECLAQVEANAVGVEQCSDPEYVHQMRVGLRRLHSAIRLFDSFQKLPRRLADEFDWLGDSLGTARDWDVLSLSTMPAIELAEPAGIDLRPLRDATVRQASAAHQAASAAVASARFTRLMLDFSGWLRASGDDHVPAAPAGGPKPTLLSSFADRAMVRAHKRLKRRSVHAAPGDAVARHRVRIAAKKLRYATEFFALLYPGKEVRRALENLSSLQDRLGAFNDLAVADRLLQELADDANGLASAVAFARGHVAASVRQPDHRYARQVAALARLGS